MKRSRKKIILMIGIVMICGLLSRSNVCLFQKVPTYIGDILWAVMMYFICAFLFIKKQNITVLWISLIVCYGIELSQLLQFQWLVYLRTTLLYYLLGTGFLFEDLIWYGLGVGIAYFLDCTILKRKDDKYE